ncbi:MAG: InlB B-repeat-containing protein, partial [Mogibacterium sp.]|nr:InlB B-repeat-containing protein [Mogibacterium sp.]
ATEVAADNDRKYEAMFAVWCKLDELNYDANGGTGDPMDPTSGKTGQAVTVSDNEYEKEGYTFVEWNTAIDGSGTSYDPEDDYTLTTGDDILYAQWVANTHKVTYSYTGDDIPADAPEVPAEATYAYGDTVTVAAAPTLEGYTFSGWSKTGSFDMPDEDVEITGSWTADEPVEYTVTYRYTGNIPTNAPAVPAPATYAAGDTVTVAAVPTLAGYTFNGWSRSGSFEMPEADVTITGSWTANNNPPDNPPDNPPGPPGPGPDNPVIDDEPTPAAPEPPATVIDDPEPPLAEGTWAVINLISAILTALGAIIALFRKKEEEDEDKENMYKEEDEDDNRGKKMLAAKIAGALAGVAAPITFFLTEDMSLPMALVDKWTVLMVAMLAVQVVAAVFNKKASELNDDDDAAEATAN